MKKMTKEMALACFGSGIDCSQVVFGYAAELMGMDPDEARRIAAAFGGGMWAGERCGCITGALMAIGYKYGHYQAGDTEAKNIMLAKKAEFEQKFLEKYDSLICEKLVGFNLTEPGGLEKMMEQNLFENLCAVVAEDACAILEEVL